MSTDTATLLGEHALHDDGKRWICVMSSDAHPQRALLCRWSRTYRRGNPDIAHRAHLAAVLDAHAAQAVREAAEKAWANGHIGCVCRNSETASEHCPNPYRADKEADHAE